MNMTGQANLYKFNEIYDKTHLDLLKYVIIRKGVVLCKRKKI